ncbi:MAG: WhiB family transcriptional regulator [Ilumatobacteraceae bacterium]
MPHEKDITMLAPNTLIPFEQPILLTAKRCADGNGTLTYLFFSEEYVDVCRAKAICAKCTSRDTCLNDALQREEPWGVWGGELLENGRVVANKRPRGRPAVHVRRPVVVDEVPIPRHLAASVA